MSPRALKATYAECIDCGNLFAADIRKNRPGVWLQCEVCEGSGYVHSRTIRSLNYRWHSSRSAIAEYDAEHSLQWGIAWGCE